jgi:hypothetical protein
MRILGDSSLMDYGRLKASSSGLLIGRDMAERPAYMKPRVTSKRNPPRRQMGFSGVHPRRRSARHAAFSWSTITLPRHDGTCERMREIRAELEKRRGVI